MSIRKKLTDDLELCKKDMKDLIDLESELKLCRTTNLGMDPGYRQFLRREQLGPPERRRRGAECNYFDSNICQRRKCNQPINYKE